MPAYILYTSRERYTVNADGTIGRPGKGSPSGQWKALALVRRNNFGHVVEIVPFDRWGELADGGRDMRHKNGKPIWRLRDLDHGTLREWGDGVTHLRTA